jgi:hypothetical protein
VHKEDKMRKLALSIAVLVLVMIGLLASGCTEAPQLRTDSERIELGGAESVRAELDMGVGALVIGGGAEDLLEAQFTFTQESWRPEVQYSVGGAEGMLSIKQPSVTGLVPGPNLRYEWDLRFDSDVPMEMKVNMGVGGGQLDLGELNLSNLDVSVGVGGAEIDLTGDWKADLAATINGGVGGVKLTLPSEVGVQVEAESGLGGIDARGFQREGDVYTNDAYGTTDVTLSINLSVGVGGAQLVLAD